MSKTRMIGTSNSITNNTCAFGSMAGLAPTTNVRPNITGINGYGVSATAANQFLEGPAGGVAITIALNTTHNMWGCGLGKSCADGTACLKRLNLFTGANTLSGFSTGGGTKLLG